MNHDQFVQRLMDLEQKFGGLVTNVANRKISANDTRTAEELAGGCTGGDRMTQNGYAPVYANYLHRFLERRPHAIAEIGILRGTGLAIWSDIFPNSRIYGLDIDTSHCEENLGDLRARGAFARREPFLMEYDQMADKWPIGGSVDVYIDDGLHSDAAILSSLRNALPHLSPGAVCFLEDNRTVAAAVAAFVPLNWTVCQYGALTVIECAS